jgi:hypothetical protein
MKRTSGVVYRLRRSIRKLIRNIKASFYVTIAKDWGGVDMAKPCSINCVYHSNKCGGKRKCEDCRHFKNEKCSKGRIYPEHINPHTLYSACGLFQDNSVANDESIKQISVVQISLF